LFICQDSGDALAVVRGQLDTTDDSMTISFMHVMTSGTTSSTTFKLRGGCDGNGANDNFYWNQTSASGTSLGGKYATVMKITEFIA
jgi:hypothetical protein